jgi:hypothetical protein
MGVTVLADFRQPSRQAAAAARSGRGKIFVVPVEEAIRIRTGEDGEEVLQLHEESEIPD